MAAERIINVCRNISGTGEFTVIVPGKAKSAASMICFGASKIIMSSISELGPIDPQEYFIENSKLKHFSVYNIIQSYDILFEKATKAEGNLEPFLLQLKNYDEKDIAEYRMQMDLAEDIAIRVLESGMMDGISKEEITKRIAVFLTPKQTKTHGRPIYADEAIRCGLNVEKVSLKTEFWSTVYELYIIVSLESLFK